MDPVDSGARQQDAFGLVGRTIEEKYRVDRVVAEGGFGVVYGGHHAMLDAPVAIKVLKPPPGLDGAATSAYVERFLGEARTVARLRHPNIVQVLDAGVTTREGLPHAKPVPWIVFEWLEGETLSSWLHAVGRPLSRGQTLRLLRPVIEALAYAHTSGVAHRDVKPDNVLLVPSPRGPSARIVDFGIAKPMSPDERASNESTVSFQANFTPGYVAPEQLAGMRTGPWTDVHALGLMLVEALAGRSAYPDASLAEIYSVALDANRRPTPATLGIDAGPWEAVIERALAFAPEDRYQNAGALLAALEETVGEALQALPTLSHVRPRSAPSLSERSSTTATVVAHQTRIEFAPPAPRRSPVVLLALATIAAIGLVAFGVASVNPLRPVPAPMPHVATPVAPTPSVPIAPVIPSPIAVPAPTPVVPVPVPVPVTPRDVVAPTGVHRNGVRARATPPGQGGPTVATPHRRNYTVD